MYDIAVYVCPQTHPEKPPECPQLIFRASEDEPEGLIFLHKPPSCGHLLATPKHPKITMRAHTWAPVDIEADG